MNSNCLAAINHNTTHTGDLAAINASACENETSDVRFVRVDRDTMHTQAQSCDAEHADFAVQFNASIAAWVDLKQIRLVVAALHCGIKVQVTPTVRVSECTDAASPSSCPQFIPATFEASVRLNTSACVRSASTPALNNFVDFDFALATHTPRCISQQLAAVESPTWHHVLQCPAASAGTHALTLLQSSSVKKVRRGNSEPNDTGFDGGYITCVLPDDGTSSYDLFLSAGIANDVSFEEEMAVLYAAPLNSLSVLCAECVAGTTPQCTCTMAR